MSFSDLRVALYVVYVVFTIWLYGRDPRAELWHYTLGLTVAVHLTRVVERVVNERRVRRDVEYLRSLDPAEAEAQIGRLWTNHARRTYTALLREEGAVERDGVVERFPFPRTAQRTASVLFFDRLLRLVLEHGGFVAQEPPDTGSEPLPDDEVTAPLAARALATVSRNDPAHRSNVRQRGFVSFMVCPPCA